MADRKKLKDLIIRDNANLFQQVENNVELRKIFSSPNFFKQANEISPELRDLLNDRSVRRYLEETCEIDIGVTEFQNKYYLSVVDKKRY